MKVIRLSSANSLIFFLLFAVSTPPKKIIVRIGREMERIGAENADRWKKLGRWKSDG